MNAKKYLMQIGIFKERIREKELELAAARSSGLRGMDYSGVRVQTSPSGTPREIMLIERIIDDINEEIAMYTKLRHNIINQIHGIADKRYERILFDRFVEGMKLSEIADRIPCAESTAYRWYNEALNVFQKKYLEGT